MQTRHAPTDPSRHTLALLGAMIVLLVAGLLGMHALNGSLSHASADGPGSGLATSAQNPNGSHGAKQLDGAVLCDGGCVVPAPDHAPEHADITACVLVLLAGLILLIPPITGALKVLRLPKVPVRTDPRGVLIARSTPDLIFLSISRT